VPDEIVAAVKDKQRQDEVAAANLAPRVAAAPVRTGADGGMHPVFVAAVKRNQVGATAYSTAALPGTIPATVRPPRIPELADSPLSTGAPIAPAPAVAHSVSNEPPMTAATPEPVRVASAEPATTGSTGAGNFFGSLFSSGSKSSQGEGTIDRMAKMIGLGRSAEAKPTAAVAKPKPEPRVAARPVARPQTSSNGAIRPKPAESKPAEAKPAEPVRTASQQPPAAAPPAPANGAISGAAPVVPAGSFDSRWSAFR
jgi:hypothetical protein